MANRLSQQYLHYPDWFVDIQIDLSQQLEKIRIPVLLLWGDQDPISPIAVGQTLQQKFPQAELHIIHGSDHAFAEHHSEAVAAHIQHYLTHFNFQV